MADTNDDDLDLSTLDRGDALPGDTPPADPPADPPKTDDPPADPPKTDDPPADPPKMDDTPADPPKTDDPPKAKKTDHMIPKSRLDHETAKRRRAEEEKNALLKRIAALEAQIKPPVDTPPDPATVPGTDEWLDAREKAYMAAVLDGEEETAMQIRREIRTQERLKVERLAEERSSRAVANIDVQKEFDDAVNLLESEFPALDAKHDDYDEVLVNSVLAAQAAILRKHADKLPGEALIEAAAKLGMKLAEQPGGNAEDDGTPPAAPATPPTVARRPATPPRGSDQAGDTPTRTRAVTEASLERMSARDKAIARGDIVG